MDCTLTQADLVAYHLAVLPDEARAEVDAHLVACTSCLRAYLALKHHMDAGRRDDAARGSEPPVGEVENAPRPSARARQRLREAVETEFTPSRSHAAASTVRRFFGKPIPLYQGLAVAAAAVLVAMALPSLASLRAPHAGLPPTTLSPATNASPHGTTDSARPVAESLSIY